MTYTLIADSGAYSFSVVFTYTGFSATLTKESSGIPDTDSGSYTLTGSTAALYKTTERSTESGSYVVAGSDAVIYKSSVGNADYSFYTIAGFSAALEPIRGFNAVEGSFALTGSAAFFLVEKYINLEASSLALTGFSVIDDNTYQGSYSAAFLDATLQKDSPLPLDPDSYLISGASTRFDLSVNSSPPVGFDESLKYDIETGRFVKILSNKICLSL